MKSSPRIRNDVDFADEADLVERRIRAEPWCFAEAYMASLGT